MALDFTSLGVAVGHATDHDGATGLTVVRGVERPLRGGVAVFGRASGTRELDALSPDHLVGGRVDAVMLTGGSAFGLSAAAGVMRWMEERRRGLSVGQGVVPIVPAAVIFDLAPLGSFDARPTPDMAYSATDAARSAGIEEGSVGAGAGATVGKIAGRERAMKGGIGGAVVQRGEVHVGALAVVNALGDVRDAGGRIIAGARADDESFLDAARVLGAGGRPPFTTPPVSTNTTIAAVIANVRLEGVALSQLARAAGAAIFRRITPAGTSFDGDVVFALCRADAPAAEPAQVEALSVVALEEAIERAVRMARGRDGIPGLADAA